MRSVSSDSGLATAELMLLMPAGVLLAGLVGSAVTISLERIALERETAAVLRELSIGREVELPSGTTAERWTEGRLQCLKLSRLHLIPISTSHCSIALS